MSILVLQSSWWGRKSWLLCLICLPGVLWWLSGSSSRCHGVVCSLWLWYFLIILAYYFQRKWCFSMEKIVGSALELSRKKLFSLDKYQLRSYGFQKLLLEWTFSCIIKNDYFIMETDTFGYIVVCTIYTPHTDHFTPQHTAFEHSPACLSVVFSYFLVSSVYRHTGWILDIIVNMNMNYSYPTTIWGSILTQT